MLSGVVRWATRCVALEALAVSCDEPERGRAAASPVPLAVTALLFVCLRILRAALDGGVSLS